MSFIAQFHVHFQNIFRMNRLFQTEGEPTMKLFLNKNLMNWHTTSSDDLYVISWPVWLMLLLVSSCPFHTFSALKVGPVHHPIIIPVNWHNSNVLACLKFN